MVRTCIGLLWDGDYGVLVSRCKAVHGVLIQRKPV